MFGIISFLGSIVGIYGFFTGQPLLLIIGGVLALLESVFGFFSGHLNGFFTQIIAVVIGVVYF